METPYTYLFGPVPSRRFGLSLGVDLTPHKTCSFNCIFCQLGLTPKTTLERREYVPTDAVCNELHTWLHTQGNANYITLSGSGEPTLHARFGDILAWLNASTTIPSVLLTNGTLLHLPEVRAAAARAAIAKVSLSAWDQASFEWVNRPHPHLTFNRLLTGIQEFRQQFSGQLWLETVLINGVNAMPADVAKIAQLAKTLEPDCVHLNTAVRPPAESFAAPVPSARLAHLAELFDPPAMVVNDTVPSQTGDMRANQRSILCLLQRRPCTSRQIAAAYGMHRNEVAKYIAALMREGQIKADRGPRDVYYAATENDS